MTWQEFGKLLLHMNDPPTREEWQAALDRARSLLPQVDEADRDLAEEIIGDTLIQTGVWLGYVDPRGTPVWEREPPGEGIANDLIGDDPQPEDGWLDVDDEGNLRPKPKRMTDPEGEGLADDLIGDDPSPPDARRFDKNGKRMP